MYYRWKDFAIVARQLLLALVFLLVLQVRGALAATLCLNSGWNLARVPDVTNPGSQISLTNFDASAWLPAVVPGTVLTSYENAGLIGDPYFGTNMATLDFDGYYDTFYWYRNSFYVPPDYAGQKLWLNLDGVNWKADIY